MSKIIESVKKYRNIITIILALVGIGLMISYAYCDTSCSYLKGDIWGIDLKWVGSAYMVAIIIFAVFQQTSFVRALLAVGLGVEIHLYAFQVQNDIYCPFCLAFSMMVIAAFIVNYEVPSAWRQNRRRMWLYFLGEVDFPMLRIHKLPLLVVSVWGYLIILLTFSGAVTLAYGQDSTASIPSLGKGKYEIIIFADYFCPPCRRIDTKAESLLKELLATNKVKITFADVPFHKSTPIYAKYYLYAVNANPGTENIFNVRRILFEAAQDKHIQTEDALTIYLTERKVSWKTMNEKVVFPLISAMIKESNIQSTPTCIIKYSAKDIKKFVGDDEIFKGLTVLKAHISRGEK